MNTDTLGKKIWVKGQPSLYQYHEIPNMPDWGNLLIWDAFLNNTASGILIFSLVAWAMHPGIFPLTMLVALTVAFFVVIIDLGCLVMDLGDSYRFIHAMRIFHVRSPLSVGVWSLIGFSLCLFVALVLGWLIFISNNTNQFLGSTGTEVMFIFQNICMWAAFAAAVGVILYKGVAFSCTSQPGLANARWLPFWMVLDSLLIGCAVNAIVAFIFGQTDVLFALEFPMIALGALRALGFIAFYASVGRRIKECYSSAINTGMLFLVVGIGGIGVVIGALFPPIGVFVVAIVTIVISLIERYWMILMIRPVKDGSKLLTTR